MVFPRRRGNIFYLIGNQKTFINDEEVSLAGENIETASATSLNQSLGMFHTTHTKSESLKRQAHKRKEAVSRN